MGKDDYNCKYCNVKVVLLKSGDICCTDCGLLYKIIFTFNAPWVCQAFTSFVLTSSFHKFLSPVTALTFARILSCAIKKEARIFALISCIIHHIMVILNLRLILWYFFIYNIYMKMYHIFF